MRSVMVRSTTSATRLGDVIRHDRAYDFSVKSGHLHVYGAGPATSIWTINEVVIAVYAPGTWSSAWVVDEPDPVEGISE